MRYSNTIEPKKNTMKTVAAFLILCTLCAWQTARAQNSDENFEDFKLILKHTGKTYLSNPDKPVEETDTMYTVCAFEFKDRSKLSRIHVKLGSEGNESKHTDVVLDLSNPGASLKQGMRYHTRGNKVYLVLGGYTGMKTYLASIAAEDKSGKKSTPLKTEKK